MSRLVMMTLMVALVVIGIAGCGGSASDEPRGGELTDARWVLSSYTVDGAEEDVPDGVTSDATFSASRVSGTGGVNQYSGPYEAGDDGGLEFGDIASTLMAGPPDATEVETAVFAAFGETASYFADDATLTLYDKDDKVLLVYDREEPGAITGVDWLCTGYNNGKQAVTSVIGDAEITALFDEAGTVSGSSGVNRYNGAFNTDGDSIEIGPLAMTKMAGDPELMEQETLYVAAMESAATYRLSGDTLELRTAEDALAVTYTRK